MREDRYFHVGLKRGPRGLKPPGSAQAPHRFARLAAGVVAQLGLRASLPLSPWVQATRTISAWPKAEKRFIRATRTWISAVWRSGSRARRRSPTLLRHPILPSARLR